MQTANLYAERTQTPFLVKCVVSGRSPAIGAGFPPAPAGRELPVSLSRGDRACVCPARGDALPPPGGEGKPSLLRSAPGLAGGEPARRDRRSRRPGATRTDRAPLRRLLRARPRRCAAPGRRRSNPCLVR